MVNLLKKLAQARAVALVGERLIRLGAAAVITVIVAQMLGPAATGYYAIVMTWSAFLAPLANLGMNNLVQKQVQSAPTPADGSSILFTAVWLRLAAGVLFGTLMWLGFAWYLPAEFDAYLPSAAALFIGQIFIAFILFEYHENYQGHFRTLAYGRLGIAMLCLLAKLWVLYAGYGIDALFWVMGVEFAATGFYQYLLFCRHNPDFGRFRQVKARLTWAKELVRRSSWLWMSGILSVVYLRIDVVMIERLLGIEQTGVYSAVSRLSELWYLIPATLAVRYYPDLLKQHQHSWSCYLLLLRKYCGYFLAMALVIAVLMFVLAPPLVPLVFGDAFAAGVPVLQIHIWAGMFIFVRYLISQHLVITGQEPLSLASHGVGAVLNVLLNFWLIPLYGLQGAAWATLISYAYASFFFLFFSRRCRSHFWQLCKARLGQPDIKSEPV